MWLIRVLIVVVFAKKAQDYSILKYALYPTEIQVKIYNQLKESDPVQAFLLEIIGTRTGRTINVSEEEFEKDPYITAYMMSFIDALKVGLLVGFLCWIFFPLYITYAVLFFFIPKLLIGGFLSIKVVLNHKFKFQMIIIPI